MQTKNISLLALLGVDQCAALNVDPSKVVTINLPDELLAQSAKQPEATALPRGESYEQMQARMELAFSPVRPEKDWRGPIDVFVAERRLDRLLVSIDDVRKAVIHFTATVPTITRGTKKVGVLEIPGWHVKAAGYRAGPAGP